MANSGGFLGKLTRTATIAVVYEVSRGVEYEAAEGWCSAISSGSC